MLTTHWSLNCKIQAVDRNKVTCRCACENCLLSLCSFSTLIVFCWSISPEMFVLVRSWRAREIYIFFLLYFNWNTTFSLHFFLPLLKGQRGGFVKIYTILSTVFYLLYNNINYYLFTCMHLFILLVCILSFYLIHL